MRIGLLSSLAGLVAGASVALGQAGPAKSPANSVSHAATGYDWDSAYAAYGAAPANIKRTSCASGNCGASPAAPVTSAPIEYNPYGTLTDYSPGWSPAGESGSCGPDGC